MTIKLVENGVFAQNDVCLIDVGAAGGIAYHWQIFANCIRAIGFEKLIEECNRLNRASDTDKIQYIPVSVGITDDNHPFWSLDGDEVREQYEKYRSLKFDHYAR